MGENTCSCTGTHPPPHPPAPRPFASHRPLRPHRPPYSTSPTPPPHSHTIQDHSDPSNTATWQQAYYLNDTFWDGSPSAPVFLCVGGEGPPLDGSVVRASAHCNVAVEWLRETKAIMFAVEHRTAATT